MRAPQQAVADAVELRRAFAVVHPQAHEREVVGREALCGQRRAALATAPLQLRSVSSLPPALEAKKISSREE